MLACVEEKSVMSVICKIGFNVTTGHIRYFGKFILSIIIRMKDINKDKENLLLLQRGNKIHEMCGRERSKYVT